jgi:hypothetical protein
MIFSKKPSESNHIVFSSRTSWNLTTNLLTLRRQGLQEAGAKILDLTESNPTHCEFSYFTRELLAPLTEAENLNYEPSPRGLQGARQAIANYYREKNIKADPCAIFLTAGTSEAYSFLFRLLLNPGERISVPRPSYPLFDFLAGLGDVIVDKYPLRYEARWEIDLDALRHGSRPETKAIILVNPNNPTGSFLKRTEFSEIVKFAKEKELALIADEVFSNYSFMEDSNRISSLAENSEALTFTLEGISKTLGLPQMKLAWIVANGPKSILQEAIERLEIILDTYLSVSMPIQQACIQWFSRRKEIQAEISARLYENKIFLEDCLHRHPSSHCLHAEGGWYAVIRIPRTKNEEEWVLEFLEKDHVFVHPGYFFNGEGEAYIVLSLLPPPKVFREGVSRIFSRIEKT